MAKNYKNIPSLKKYVLTKKDKDIKELEKSGLEWAKICSKNRLSYEIEWLGVPIIQTSEDVILLQEIIFNVQPDIIIESGIAHGGGMIFEASLLELLGKGKVIGVDIEIRKHNRKVIETHPLSKRIEMIEGSSIAPETIEQIKKRIPKAAKVIVCLDSNHTKSHVLKELELYQQFVSRGSYIIAFDTLASELAKSGIERDEYIDNGPMEAIKEFLKKNKRFEIDTEFNKLYSSHNQNGFLKRIK